MPYLILRSSVLSSQLCEMCYADSVNGIGYPTKFLFKHASIEKIKAKENIKEKRQKKRGKKRKRKRYKAI